MGLRKIALLFAAIATVSSADVKPAEHKPYAAAELDSLGISYLKNVHHDLLDAGFSVMNTDTIDYNCTIGDNNGNVIQYQGLVVMGGFYPVSHIVPNYEGIEQLIGVLDKQPFPNQSIRVYPDEGHYFPPAQDVIDALNSNILRWVLPTSVGAESHSWGKIKEMYK